MHYRMIICLMTALLLFNSCNSSNVSKPTAAPQVKFEIKNFELKYKESDYSKSYSGEGTVLAVGNPDATKSPYMVIVSIEKSKGGNAEDDQKTVLVVPVIDGLGKITTYTTATKKENLEKPEYKIEVNGYVQLLPIDKVQSGETKGKVSFDIKNFNVTKEENARGELRFTSYKGNGMIVTSGDQQMVKNPYLVLVKVDKIKSAGKDNSDATKYVLIPVFDSIGIIKTADFGGMKAFFRGQLVSDTTKNYNNPEYKLDVIGYKDAKI
jgi:hypothetical protein